MSLDFLVALPGPPPVVAALSAALVAEGGAKGTWKTRVEAAGVQISLTDLEDFSEVIADAFRSRKKKPFEVVTLLQLTGGGADGVEAVGEALLDLCGGIFLTEGGDVFAVRASPRKAAGARAAKAPKGPAIDVSIPEAVLHDFLAPQHIYSLAGRKAPALKFTAVVKALDPQPRNVGFSRLGGPWDANAIGDVLLKERRGSDLRFYGDQLARIGLPAPAALFGLSFKYWHLESVPEDAWRAMLGVACALGRDTRGILYRIDREGRAVTHDFG